MSHREPPDPLNATISDAIPVAPSLEPVLTPRRRPPEARLIEKRLLLIVLLCACIAAVASVIALLLVKLIALITNIAFFQRFSAGPVSPADNRLGWWVVPIPAIGGIIVGILARYGSRAIRGHGIPEAMEQVLTGGSVIPARLTFLKPVSAAISIGTGGPFGAEGPIIASGGAFGSLVGQLLRTTAQERKTLLAAGAAAGMTAIFGSPVSAVLLAIELLVFEYRARSFVPIACAAACAGALRVDLFGAGPAFHMPAVSAVTASSMIAYVIEGLLIGAVSIVVTKIVYAIEDGFEELPIHWMWWPALGGLVVGIIGYWYPHTMGVGYDNIDRILSADMPLKVVGIFALMKLVSWSISLGTGTSGGTLAPLFTVGGGVGLLYGGLLDRFTGGATVDLSVAALVGMAAIFSGASRAMLASTVFAFETTREPAALLPLLGGCTAAYLVSSLRMSNTIMTEKIVRRGINVPSEYEADPLAHRKAGEIATRSVVTLKSDETVAALREKLQGTDPRYQHQGYPVIDAGTGRPIGVVTRKQLRDAREDRPLADICRRPAIAVGESSPLPRVRDVMAAEDIGRLLVTDQAGKLVGIITRSDVFRARSTSLDAETKREIKFSFRRLKA